RRQRDAWLGLGPAGLLAQGGEERYRRRGRGGQRRNKVETAVRLGHLPSGVVSEAEEARALGENRKRAVRRLRERLALNCRARFDLAEPSLPPEFVEHRRGGSLAINQRNQSYPLVVATVLDALVAAKGSYAKAASALGLTTSPVVRFLEADR